MVRWEEGRVRRVLEEWPGALRLEVEVGSEAVPALAYPDLVGQPAAGDRVLLNTNALRRRLGTGGLALVVAVPDHLPAPPEVAGHLVKARYTPLQTMVAAVDDPERPEHEVMQAASDLAGMPVITCDLHSSLPAVVAGIRLEDPRARVVYVHTDGAALPVAFSRTVAALREHDLVQASISVGQSFGGDLEAVSLHSGLLAARHVLDADLVVVSQGPGNLGSDTPWGFSGVQVADALNAAGVLGGTPVGALRVSSADARPRHRGLSHHSMTAYGRATLVPTLFAVPWLPPGTDSDFHASVQEQLRSSILFPGQDRGVRHQLSEVSPDGVREALEELPVRLSTMGRSLAEDFEAFLYAALAGRAAQRSRTAATAGAGDGDRAD